jgi:hypothetical protein
MDFTNFKKKYSLAFRKQGYIPPTKEITDSIQQNIKNHLKKIADFIYA